MTQKTAKGNGMTLRQRLRADAEKKLETLHRAMRVAGKTVCEDHATNIDPALLMQLASNPEHSKTLRYTLITQLANEKEAALEKLYNNQMDMLQE